MRTRPTWEPVTDLSPKQEHTRRILLTLIPVIVFLTVLAGISLYAVTR